MHVRNYDLGEILFSSPPSTFYRASNRVLGNPLLVRRLEIDPARGQDVHDTFYREQRHCAGLNHPRIFTAIDAFEEDGYLWSVHEWRRMRPTHELVAEQRGLALAEAARIGAQAADTLAYMHERGFVHGRFAPQFVLMDERGDTKLTNLVKSSDLAAGIWPLRERVLGLSEFSAPEEHRGEKPTAKSDLFSLASTFVFWVSGKYVNGATTSEDALAHNQHARLSESVADVIERLPPSLRRALDGALHPDPEQRCGSAAALGSLFVELEKQHAAEVPAGFETGTYLEPVGLEKRVQLLGRHGAGAFGVVIRGRGENDNGDGTRDLAVKALKPQFRDDQVATDRFVREARVLLNIQHPNVVSVKAVGFRRATPYVVMEFVEGPDLGTILLRLGELEPRRVARIGAGIARGLSAIHREGIVHRDLKPQNILVRRDDHPVITDFGTAKGRGGEERLTMTGHLVGTPLYMAPEQVTNDELGPATDLFALGVILYEMLTGRTPHDATDLMTLLQAIRAGEVRPLPDSAPRRLAHITMRLLETEPGARYPGASLVADELERTLEVRPGSPSDAGPGVARRDSVR